MIRAWHWTQVDKTLGYSDGRVVVAGQTLIHEGELVLCEQGLHASTRVLDALLYAPGCYVWRVELSGTIVEGRDKLVASKRKAIWGFDADEVLQDFARRCVLDVIHLWNPPDVMMGFLRTGDRSLVTAAARAAARAAADRAAYAAYAAAGAVAAKARTGAAADAAAVARTEQNRRLTSMVMAEARRRHSSGEWQ